MIVLFALDVNPVLAVQGFAKVNLPPYRATQPALTDRQFAQQVACAMALRIPLYYQF